MGTQTVGNLLDCKPAGTGQAGNFVRNAFLGAVGGAAGQLVANLGRVGQAALYRANLLSLGKGGGYIPANATLGPNANAVGTAIGNGVSNLGGFSNYPSWPGWY